MTSIMFLLSSGISGFILGWIMNDIYEFTKRRREKNRRWK